MQSRHFAKGGRTAQRRRRPRPTEEELEQRRRERAVLRDKLVADAIQRSASPSEVTYEHISSDTGFPVDLLRWAYPNIDALINGKQQPRSAPTPTALRAHLVPEGDTGSRARL